MPNQHTHTAEYRRLLEIVQQHPDREACISAIQVEWGITRPAARKRYNRALAAHPHLARDCGSAEVEEQCDLGLLDPDETQPDGFVEHGDDAVLTATVDGPIRTLDQLLDGMGVDRSVWEVADWQPNAWTGADGTQMYQAKARLRRIAKSSVEQRVYAAIQRATEGRRTGPEFYISHPEYHQNLLLRAMYDLHLGKMGLDHGTSESVKVNRWAREELYRKSSGYQLSQILIAASELAHTENGRTTTAGTPQDSDRLHDDAVDLCYETIVEEVERALEIAPVGLVYTPGNHGWQTEMNVAKMVSIHFRNNKHVTVQRGGRIYYPFGVNLLGFAHGNNEKHAMLPLLMADEEPELWGRSRYREWILGHFHHKKKRDYLPIDEVGGVRIRIMSSLSPKDEWHHRMGYNAVKAAEALIYNHATGYETHIAANVLKGMLPAILAA